MQPGQGHGSGLGGGVRSGVKGEGCTCCPTLHSTFSCTCTRAARVQAPLLTLYSCHAHEGEAGIQVHTVTNRPVALHVVISSPPRSWWRSAGFACQGAMLGPG